jgi:hypothetical protein
MRRFRTPALFFCLQLALLTSAQQPTQSPPPPQTVTSAAAPVPPAAELIRSSVGFLMVAYRDGLVQGGAIGTCFFVWVPDNRLGENQGFVYYRYKPTRRATRN